MNHDISLKVKFPLQGAQNVLPKKVKDLEFREDSKTTIFLIHLFTCAYIVWAISPPYILTSPSLPPPPSLPGRTCSALLSNFVEEKT
jgi:hypothetical protein